MDKEIQPACGGFALGGLPARQRQIYELLLGGEKNQEIANRLQIAIPTVKAHIRFILRKFGVVRREQLLAHVLWFALHPPVPEPGHKRKRRKIS